MASRVEIILGDPGAANQDDRMFMEKVYYKIDRSYIEVKTITNNSLGPWKR